MRRLFAMVFGALLGAAAMFMAFKFHVIRIKDDVVFVPKPSAALVDAYVDVREWTTAEWAKHPQLVKALILNGRADLVRRSVTARWKDKIFGEQNGATDDDRKPDDTTQDSPLSVERR
jgi:hypothetical protein